MPTTHANMSEAHIPPCPSVGIILCAVLESELTYLSRQCRNVQVVCRLPQGLHNEPPKLRHELQIAVDEMERCEGITDIVLGYGLCSRGVEGVTTRRCRLILPRAHDCITLLLGCRHRYAQYVAENPGTYWYSPGWNKHHIPPGPERYNKLRAKYVQQFGEENADYLMETEQAWFATYNRATFVDVGVHPCEGDACHTQQCAKWLGWSYDRQHGDIGLMRDMVSGVWDDRFLIIQPGQTARLTADERVVEAVSATAAP